MDFISNLSERKKAENRQWETEKRHDDFVGGVCGACRRVYLERKIIKSDSAFGKITEHTRAESEETIYQNIVSELWRKRKKETVDRILPSGFSESWEKERSKGDESVWPVDAGGGPMPSEKGEPGDILRLGREAVGHGLVERSVRKGAEHQGGNIENPQASPDANTLKLNELESLAVLGRMISVVAHEIRNPLQNIKMGIESLRTASSEGTHFEILDEMNYGVDLMDGLIHQLLEYSKPALPRLAEQSLQRIVERVLTAQTHCLQNIDVSLDIENPATPLLIDEEKVFRLLSNIVANAIDAMPNGGTLEITSRLHGIDTGGCLEIAVSDTGAGIKEGDREQIFQPFFTTKPRGTGLGLAICRKITDGLGGTIELASKKQGTTVKVSLPLALS